MIWLTWRQFRVQALTAAAAVAAFAILLAATGPGLASRYAASGITGCHGGGCMNAAIGFLVPLANTTLYPAVYELGIAVILVAPAIIGLFWGAPLIARELETRTFTLAWNQSITRTRWLAVKLTLTGLAAMAVTEALSLMYAWWAEPIGRAFNLGARTTLFDQNQFSSLMFATRGITPFGYAAFAFTLGTAAGALIRRTVPAMAVTLAIFAAVQVAMPLGGVCAGGRHRHARRHRRPRLAWRLDHLQRSGQRGGAAGQPRRGLRLLLPGGGQGPERASRVAVPGPQGHPRGRHLPARQPLLALAVRRDRDLPGPRPGPGRVLLLAARPQADLTCSARIKASGTVLAALLPGESLTLPRLPR